MRELLFLEPVLKENIWGGNRLQTEYGYNIPSSHTGECWAVSAHPNGDCLIRNGRFQGMHLSQVWEQEPELFGQNRPQGSHAASPFPLLVKIIDARQDLSIQVHPDDSYARIHEHGSLGKTECWYILDCEENASIIIGHHARTKLELESMIKNKEWSRFLRTVPVKKGDFFQIDPGCVHAIKGGTLILETQQSSDITYRVYDYDRLSDGKPRPLHLEQSMDVITVPYEETKKPQPVSFLLSQAVLTRFISCSYYTVDQYQVHGSLELEFPEGFTNVSILEGEGFLNGTAVHKGQHLIVTAGSDVCVLSGDFNCICSSCLPCSNGAALS